MIAYRGEDRHAAEVLLEERRQICHGGQVALLRVLPHIVRVDVARPQNEVRFVMRRNPRESILRRAHRNVTGSVLRWTNTPVGRRLANYRQ